MGNLITAPYNWKHEALTRLLVEKGVFTKDEFLEMVRVVNQEMKIKPKDV